MPRRRHPRFHRRRRLPHRHPPLFARTAPQALPAITGITAKIIAKVPLPAKARERGKAGIRVAIKVAIGAGASAADIFAGVADRIAALDVICLRPNMRRRVLLRRRDPTSHPPLRSLPAITLPSFFPANRSQNTKTAFQELLRWLRPQRICHSIRRNNP